MTFDPSWPSQPASAEVAGHVELLVAGAYDPLPNFLNPLVLELDEHTKHAAEAAGHLVLTDDEGAPIAVLDEVRPNHGAAIAGHVRPIEHESSGLASSVRYQRDAIRKQLADAPAIAVTLDRPLTVTEEDALARLAADKQVAVLLLACTGGASASGVPPDVTVRAARLSAERMSTRADTIVASLPLVPHPEGHPPTGSREVAASVGATLLGADGEPSPLDAAAWARVVATLRAAVTEVDLPTQPAITGLLRRWCPPRPHRGVTVFFTGLSGSGKSTIARGVVAAIRERYDRTVTLVDGDVARQMLSTGLGFSRPDRELNIRRIGWVAAEITRHGGLAVCAPIAPYAATRAEVRRTVEVNGDFVLIHVATPLEVCERRDRKGLYAKARAGLISEFTGISDPYEVPSDADLRLDTSEISIEQAIATVLDHLERNGWLRTAR